MQQNETSINSTLFFLSYNHVGVCVAYNMSCFILGYMDFLALTSLLAQKYTPFCSGSHFLSAIIKFSLEQQFNSGSRELTVYTKVIMQCWCSPGSLCLDVIMPHAHIKYIHTYFYTESLERKTYTRVSISLPEKECQWPFWLIRERGRRREEEGKAWFYKNASQELGITTTTT